MSKKTAIIAAASAFILSGLGAACSSESPKVEAVAPTATATAKVPGPITTAKAPGPATTAKAPGPLTTVKVPGPVKTVIKKVAVPGPKAFIGEGEWKVGVDVLPGVYKLKKALARDAECTYSITRSANPNDVVSDNVSVDKKPSLTLKRGQIFFTRGCGTWAKQ